MALTRDTQPLPDDVARRLDESGLRDAYDARPAYQRNDYLRWIAQAVRESTRSSRVERMLDELREGGVYMGMAHAPSRRA